MKKLLLYKIAIGLATVLSFSACSNFDEINSNPNAIVTANSSLLCTYNILAITKFNGDAKGFIGESALSKYVGYANEGQMSQQYNSSFGSGSFGLMNILPDIDQMVEYAKGTTMENSYRGIAKFLRARLFYGITMQIGDIPYSETNQGLKGNYQPKYDTQEDVLLGILDELKEADNYFANGVTFSGDPTPYNGDPDKWRRASNAFALRILMSLSNKVGNTKIEIKKRFADIVSKGYLMTSATGYWGLSYSTTNNFPLYSTSNAFTSRTIPSNLLTDNLKLLNDRRLFYYAEPSVAKIKAGFTQTDPMAYVGVDVSIDYSQMNTNHTAGVYSLINNHYQLEQASEPRMLITFSEQQFILAEACIRGWITGSAQNYYQSGVQAALSTIASIIPSKYAHGMPIDASYISNYFTGEASFKSTTDQQLNQIWMQRYLMNLFQDPLTSYFEYRRTGYPSFPINPNTNLNPNTNYKDKIPVRLTYPSDEKSFNKANCEDAITRQFGKDNDEVNQLMWILK